MKKYLIASAVAAAIAVLSAAAPAQAGTPRPRLAWGAQAMLWPQLMRAVPDASVVRFYYDTPDNFAARLSPAAIARGEYNAIPSAWPHLVNPHTGRMACAVVSIRTLLHPLVTHQLDSMLAPLKRTAPHRKNCDFLTAWHEVNAPSRPYPHSVRVPANFRRITEYLMHYFRGSYVKVGAIVAGPANNAEQYLVRGEGFVSNDVYQFGPQWYHRIMLTHRLTQNLKAAQAATGERYPIYILSETNAKADWRRPAWYEWISTWFARHDKLAPFRAAITFWPDGGPGKHAISGPWSSASARTRLVLRLLAQRDSR